MKTTRKYLIALAVIVVPLTGIWAYRETHPALTSSPEAAGSTAPAEGKAMDRGAPRPGRKEIRDKARAWHKQLLEDRPEMAVSFRQVAPEDNGYLQWLDFIDECRANGAISGNDFNLPDDLKGIFDGDLPWDGSRVGKWLEENREMLERIVALGLLPDHSAAGIDSGRIGANPAVPQNLAPILLARARHALESGNPSIAMESLASLVGSAGHADGIETPTYLGMVGAAGIRARILNFAAGEGIEDADAGTLQQLRDLISKDRQEAASFARFTRGDWLIMSENYLLPTLLGEGNLMSDIPPRFLEQPELIAASYADVSADLVRHWDKTTLRELLAPLPERGVTPPAGLSEQDRAHFEMLTHGLIEGLAQGWALQQIQNAMTDAALAISLGEEAPVEPVTGKPFVIDEASGTLKLPDDPVFSGTAQLEQKIPARRK